MAINIQPGPLPKDGQAFGDVETELENFVNRTDITNIGLDSFVPEVTPFVVSSSEPPLFKTPGQLWFNRTEGRLYCRFERGMSSASWAVLEGGGATLSNSAHPMDPKHWISVSDRKEVYAQCFSAFLDIMTLPFAPVRLEAGKLDPAQSALNADTKDWALGENRDQQNLTENLWGANDAFLGYRLGPWGQNIWSSKLFVHTTNYTIPGRVAFAGIFHEVGFRRVASTNGAEGPFYAGLRGVQIGAEGSDPANIRAAADTHRAIHDPGGSAYDWDQRDNKAFVGYATQSGPATDDPRTHLTFWFGNCPRPLFRGD